APRMMPPKDAPEGYACYYGAMFCSVVLSVAASVQPFCTKPLFTLLEQNVVGDNAFIIEVLYDEYLEEARELDVPHEELISPVAFMQAQRDKETKADVLFDSFLESVSILQKDLAWQAVIQTIRRRALLHAREIQNPWKNTTWFDVATQGVHSAQLLSTINAFLLQYADVDRADRYAAKIAKLQGDQETCAEAERRTMKRWSLYNDIIEPAESVQMMSQWYPSLKQSDDGIGEMMRILMSGNEDSEQKKVMDTIFQLHVTVYEKSIRDLVALVKQTRITEGIDLLSDGCGISTKAKNEILQKTAEIHELNMITIKSIQKLLTDEQLQELEQDG
ncbi:MAG: hypothetical protein ACI9GC_000349, partial [Phycisphaerales bacterium]